VKQQYRNQSTLAVAFITAILVVCGLWLIESKLSDLRKLETTAQLQAQLKPLTLGDPTPLPWVGEWNDEEEPDIDCETGKVGVFGALPPRDSWLSKFNAAKRAVIRNGHPLCEGCGRSPEECGKLSHDAHHVRSVEIIETELNDDGSKKYPPELKWDQGNLIILCRPALRSRLNPDDKGCHFLIGHKGESWAVSDPDVAHKAAKNFARLNPGWTYEQRVDEYYANYPSKMPAKYINNHRSAMERKTQVAP
jgi:hypothetical protein